MNKRVGMVLAVVLLVAMLATAVSAAPLFVATAKNFRGALYLGYGPTPHMASEQALSKCSQDSFIAPSCRVLCVRAECPPPCPVPSRKFYKPKTRISKTRYYSNAPVGGHSQ